MYLVTAAEMAASFALLARCCIVSSRSFWLLAPLPSFRGSAAISSAPAAQCDHWGESQECSAPNLNKRADEAATPPRRTLGIWHTGAAGGQYRFCERNYENTAPVAATSCGTTPTVRLSVRRLPTSASTRNNTQQPSLSTLQLAI